MITPQKRELLSCNWLFFMVYYRGYFYYFSLSMDPLASFSTSTPQASSSGQSSQSASGQSSSSGATSSVVQPDVLQNLPEVSTAQGTDNTFPIASPETPFVASVSEP